MAYRVLAVDDDPDYLEILKIRLAGAGFAGVRVCHEAHQALALFQAGQEYDLALIDMTMPEMDGLELLERIRALSPATECIMVTAVNEARVAVECLKKGAYDYLVKPVSQEDLAFALARCLERKRLLELLEVARGRARLELDNPAAFAAIITSYPGLLQVMREAELHAASSLPVLITGESGTGKELLARAIHAASPRAAGPFTAVNMISVAENLFETEFFGHAKGAFTGAAAARRGYLESSKGGTLFLDEIGNLHPEMQGKLLRVLQDGDYLKVGDHRAQKADVRFIAATNEDLESLMNQRRFRKDLFYRIRGGWLHLPPLRQRPGDVELLTQAFLREFAGPEGPGRLSAEARECLLAHDYPGNVRELKTILQAAVNLAQGGSIAPRHLPVALRRRSRETGPVPAGEGEVATLAQVDRDHILKVYGQTSGNKSQTARLLGIGLNTLRRKLEAYGVD